METKKVNYAIFEDGFYKTHDCYICGKPIGYRVVNGRPYLDFRCDCDPNFHAVPVHPYDFREFLTFIWPERKTGLSLPEYKIYHNRKAEPGIPGYPDYAFFGEVDPYIKQHKKK